MKKLLIMALALVGLTMASCGNKAKSGDAADSAAVDSTEAVATAAEAEVNALGEQLQAGDASAVEKTFTTIKEKYDELVSEGKVEEAAKYASQVKAFIDEHAEEIKNVANGNTTVSGLIDAVTNLPTNATDVANAAAAAVNADASAVKEAVEAAPEAAKEAAKAKVEEVKKEAANKVEEKANEAVNKGVDKALKGVGLK